MKIVFICNKDYEDKITRPNDGKGFDFCGVHILFEKEHGKTEEVWGNEEYIKRIASVNEFDPDTVNSFFSDGDFRQNQVFVMPELLWSDCSVDEGYEMALQLLKRLKDKPFVLRFISNFTQDQLLHMVNKKYHSMVETFPHICINDVVEGHYWIQKFTLKPEEYSATHFQLIRNIAISHWGRLEYIEHQLKPRNNNCPAELKEHFLKLLSELDDDAYRFDGSGERIKQLMEEVNATCPSEEASDDEKSEYANTIVSHIQPLIATIRRMLPADEEGEQGQQKPGKLPYQVLVIDDDEKERKDLCEFFGTYYEHVACNDDGSTFEIADAQAAKDWMAKHASEYHIIILDLLFMGKDNIWMPYSGLDLLKLIPSYCTVRVITRLPRQRVGEIAKAAGIKLDAGQILTKSIGWKQLEGCLYDRRDEINKECKKNEKQRTKAEDLRMPRIGTFFTNQFVRDTYRSLILYDHDKFKDMVKEARDKVSHKESVSLLGKGKEIENDENFIIDNFIKYLAHRWAFLQWAATTGTIVTQGINWTSYVTYGKNNYNINVTINSNYFSTIGFRRKKVYVNLVGEELFPEEMDYFVAEIRNNTCFRSVSPLVTKWMQFVVYPTLCNNNKIKVRNKFKDFENNILRGNVSFDWKLLEGLLCECIEVDNSIDYKQLFQPTWFNEDKEALMLEIKQNLGNNETLASLLSGIQNNENNN